MKYYIPTTTLNFNNILSSESISPKSFFAKRGFGYPRWISVQENDIDNAILLYDSPIEVLRPVSDEEDHPMLIEITSDETFRNLENGIYYCNETIYLTPETTRILFFSESDKITTLSMSASSLETKLVNLYKNKFNIIDKNEIKKNQSINTEKYKDLKLNESAIEKDCKINKMKGLLYGFYIGALLSTSTDIVKKRNLLKALHNTFSAILSSEGKSTKKQDDNLKILLIQLLIPETDKPIKKYSKLPIEDLYLFLYEVFKEFPQPTWTPLYKEHKEIVSNLKTAVKGENPVIGWLEEQNEQLFRKQDEKQTELNPSKKEISVNNGEISYISQEILPDKEEEKLTLSWINEVLLNPKYNGKVSLTKEDFATTIMETAVRSYGDRWESSKIRGLLNAMYRYVLGKGEDSKIWNNLLVASMAAVIAKGDDWNQLLNFMYSKSMTDYRLAFAFYGELNGFANLTRDFTDILLNRKPDYVQEVYKEFNKQLLNNNQSQRDNSPKEYDSKLNTVSSSVTSQIPTINQGSNQNDKTNLNESSSKKQENVDTDNHLISNEKENNTSSHESSWQEKAEAFKKEKYKRNVQKWKFFDEILHKYREEETPEAFLNELKGEKGWCPDKNKRPNNLYKELLETLHPRTEGQKDLFYNQTNNAQDTNTEMKKDKGENSNIKTRHSSSHSINTSSQNEYKRHFYNDEGAWNIIESTITDNEAKKQIYEDFKWFTGEMKQKPSERDYYKYLDAENDKAVIKSFCKLKSDKNQAPYFTPEMRKNLKEKLMKRYVGQN